MSRSAVAFGSAAGAGETSVASVSAYVERILPATGVVHFKYWYVYCNARVSWTGLSTAVPCPFRYFAATSSVARVPGILQPDKPAQPALL